MLTGPARMSATATAAVALALLHSPVDAADAPVPTVQKILQEHRLDASLLKGLDKELSVPEDWSKGAKKEGTVRVRLSLNEDQFVPIAKAFNERYPGVTATYTKAVGRNRAVSPLVAFKAGTYTTDIAYGFMGAYHEYKNAGALERLDGLPVYDSVPADMKSEDGIALGYTKAYWCMAYNTNRLKASELPKTWDDLVVSKRLGNGALGMASRPFLWLINLQGVYGIAWTDAYMAKMFDVLKPQLRKESMTGMLVLLNVGEFDATLPAAPQTVSRQADKGAAVSFHCPEPVPVAYSPIGIFKGNPHPNASRLFVNWFLSKEGQIVSWETAGTVPSHKDLQTREFLPFADTILGKKVAPLTERDLDATTALNERWNILWQQAGTATDGR